MSRFNTYTWNNSIVMDRTSIVTCIETDSGLTELVVNEHTGTCLYVYSAIIYMVMICLFVRGHVSMAKRFD